MHWRCVLTADTPHPMDAFAACGEGGLSQSQLSIDLYVVSLVEMNCEILLS